MKMNACQSSPAAFRFFPCDGYTPLGFSPVPKNSIRIGREFDDSRVFTRDDDGRRASIIAETSRSCTGVVYWRHKSLSKWRLAIEFYLLSFIICGVFRKLFVSKIQIVLHVALSARNSEFLERARLTERCRRIGSYHFWRKSRILA